MLDISLGLLIASAAVFLIMLVVLNKWLYKPLIKFMDDRDASIKKDLENAGKNTSDVDSLYKEAEAIIAKAKHEASSMREKATFDAKKLAEEKISSKRTELEREYSEFISSLESEKANLKNALLSQMPLFKESLKAKFSQL
jgi:F-type H+-transporting ATPase subunit b